MRSRMDVFIRRQRIQSCRKWIERAMIAEAFFIALIPDIAVIALFIGIFCWIARLRLDRTFTLRSLPLDFPIALFAGISFLSTFNSESVGFSLGSWFQTVGFYLATYIFFGQNLRSLDQIKDVALALFASAGFVVLHSIYQIFFGLDTAELPWLDPKIQPTARNRIYSTLGSPNLLAGYLDICICLALGVYQNANDWMKKSVLTIFVAILLILLSMTFSRAAMITIALVIVFYSVKQKIPTILAVFVATIVGILYFEPGLVERFQTSLDFEGSSIGMRFSLWKMTLLMISDHPFLGVGWNSYRLALAPYDFLLTFSENEILNASNLYLNCAAETGIAGMLAFLWCLIEPVIIAFRLEWLEEKIQAFRIRVQTFLKDRAMRFFTPPDEKIPERPKVDLKKHSPDEKLPIKIEEDTSEQKKSPEDESSRATVISFEVKRQEKTVEHMQEGSFHERLKTNLRPGNLLNWTEREVFDGLRSGIGLSLISIALNGFAYDLPNSFATATLIWILVSLLICVCILDS